MFLGHRLMNAGSEDAKPDVVEALAGLRSRFIDSLVDRILHMENLTSELHRTGDYTTALYGISASAHRIAGVAGTLGFGALGSNARKLEEAITEGLTQYEPRETFLRTRTQLEALLDSLEAVLETAP